MRSWPVRFHHTHETNIYTCAYEGETHLILLKTCGILRARDTAQLVECVLLQEALGLTYSISSKGHFGVHR